MGYHYRSSGLGGIDILVTTGKGGLPHGVIVPIGYYNVPEYRRKLSEFRQKYDLNLSVAVHSSESENDVILLRTPEHVVNRFGAFLSVTDPFEFSTEDYDIAGKGTMVRKNVKTVDEIGKWMNV